MDENFFWWPCTFYLIMQRICNTLRFRVIVTKEELAELKAAFAGGSGDIDDRSDVDLCVGCSRKVTYGDFGLDHVSCFVVVAVVAPPRHAPKQYRGAYCCTRIVDSVCFGHANVYSLDCFRRLCTTRLMTRRGTTI